MEPAHMKRFQTAERYRKSARSQVGFTRYRAADAVVTGNLEVTDADALLQQIGTGIGRQQAFGWGMLRLALVPGWGMLRLALVPVRAAAAKLLRRIRWLWEECPPRVRGWAIDAQFD